MSRLLTGHKCFEDFKLPLAKVNYKILQKLLVDAGESAESFAILEPACLNSGKPELEYRKMKVVNVYVNALNAGVSFSELPSLAQCEFEIPASFEPEPVTP